MQTIHSQLIFSTKQKDSVNLFWWARLTNIRKSNMHHL
ncbi:hypothetical protein PECL_1581 [Pediococcus claussenii ATCC BAA-344]|uniref:Uncharacterized protein n=1 Tax=Pediococcus claussenii (strain ATCC BAA-344 / DSM 14800 / JCM 18046 / KCTC 3811 / LMG 21948 / P06) TaxID=701521 RepID=G8PAL0_PEDCP|nr:hypothetical protein PECL_1581 [Pediococcus claussenii ATCC BAA-344]